MCDDVAAEESGDTSSPPRVPLLADQHLIASMRRRQILIIVAPRTRAHCHCHCHTAVTNGARFSPAFSSPRGIAAGIFRASRRNFELPVPEKAITRGTRLTREKEKLDGLGRGAAEGKKETGDGEEKGGTEREEKEEKRMRRTRRRQRCLCTD